MMEEISWGQLLSEAKDTLAKANVPDADIDAWLLMEHCFSITKSFFFLNRRQIVEQKEKIKALKSNVHVLSVSATPIPRSLQMSLVGIRDLSLIESAPKNRYPVQTYVLERNERIISFIVLNPTIYHQPLC